ncbi:hypothetical protein ABZ490_29535 [Streptomyces sp. NPDC005811]|uniref:hypothetical protein n=1 Tax=Streptomyces sp. NPDC005811 TaxID=3154565 RepID=UPI0033C21118
MNDRPLLAAVNDPASTPDAAAAPWSLIPPKLVRQAFYQRVKEARRPAGTLALPAITATGTLYYTGAIQHADTPMALGLTALVVLYDSVIAVCRTWRTTDNAATAQGRYGDGARKTA